MKRVLLLLAIAIIAVAILQRTNVISLPNYWFFDVLKPQTQNTPSSPLPSFTGEQRVVYEESVITELVERSLPSVVTVGIKTTARSNDSFEIDPFNPFSPFRRIPGQEKEIEQNIGSGFIISQDGLVITNKHVVGDSQAEYTVLTNDDKTYTVERIYRDPLNDLAILKINATGLKPLELGDSTKIKLGQLVVAIGTPLGEFTNTVTSGIVSGLGRGITAGSPFEGSVEKLNNVIQTDAAINPGNSGGPLLNSAGQVIGINTAVASEGQNIGFAIPVSIVQELIKTFENQGGNFERPYIGVRYQMIDRATAIRLEVAEGAYVIEVLENSPAAKADIQLEDIITTIDGKKVQGNDDQSLAKIITGKKIGDKLQLRIWRSGETIEKTVTLEGTNQ